METVDLCKFFKCTDPHVCMVLENALIEASNRKHTELRIEHIVLEYIQQVELFRETEDAIDNVRFGTCREYMSIPWLEPSNDYEKKSSLRKFNCSNQNFSSLDLHDDVVKLSKYYIRYSNLMNFETFYLLLVYLNYYNEFASQPYIPWNKIDLTYLCEGEFFDMLTKYHRPYFQSTVDLFDFISKHEKNGFSDFSKNFYRFPVEIELTTDITHLAYEDKLPEVIGREEEISRMIDILCKKDRNNVTLLGEPGVGKTALVYALAQKLVKGDVPDRLKQYYILQFEPVSAISGTKYRGDFEEKIDNLFKSIKESGKNIIICIDEIHTTMNLGSAADASLSFSDMLKPFLLNPCARIIGTSTFKEYLRVEEDKALQRRFCTITVNANTVDETVEILEKVKHNYEDAFNIQIPKSTIVTLVKLSERYIPERFLPDKAFDILDEACSMTTNNFEGKRCSKLVLSETDVAKCISRMTRIPVQDIEVSRDFNNLEKFLNSRVIGQEHATEVLAKAIKRSKAGLNDENKPMASFMFVGPTGVGKTEIAKALAEAVFGSPKNMIRLDMSEFMEEFSVSKLIGAPPGYVGYESAGQLTEQVRHNPYSLILFDEFEKAHPKIQYVLLQILDEGMLTDSKGEHVNFKNTIIIFTSNVGAREATKRAVGFNNIFETDKSGFTTEMKKSFSPEFLNRLDEIVVFNNLSKEDIHQITKINVEKSIIKKLEARRIDVKVDDDVYEWLGENGYSEEYGARELLRTICKEIKDPLADFLISNIDVKSVEIALKDSRIFISTREAVMC